MALQRDCVSACAASKQAGVDAASRYYQNDLPRRIAAEKQTLAKLTGWKMSDIDAMPNARWFTADASPHGPAKTDKPWREELFKNSTASR